MMQTSLRMGLLAMFFLMLGVSGAGAHDARPIVVNLEETAEGVRVEWRVPRIGPILAQPEIAMPTGCVGEEETVRADLGDSVLYGRIYRCEAGLAGSEVAVRHRVNPGLSTLIRATLASGGVRTKMMPPGETTWRIPEEPTRRGVAADYLTFGMRHIGAGVDHLMFLAALLLIARTRRQILITVTGFTVAHSITLALSAFDVVRLPSLSVEFAVALSIVFVAAEIARKRDDTLTQRHPVAVSSAFGLLHGFGFASVLRETGLPEGEALTALFFFNVGVEMGQILFIVLVWVELALVGRIVLRRFPGAAGPTRMAVAYGIGIAAAFWAIERFMGA